MTPEARRAVAVIRECVETDHYALSLHFSQRMRQRGLFWPDVLAVIDHPGGQIEIVCVIEVDESETEFITLYWED